MQLMTNLDYFFLAKELNQALASSRLNKAYQIGDKEFRFKFHKEGEKNLVVQLGARMHLTKYLQTPPENPSNLARIIRSKLSNAKVVSVNQVNFDRIIEFEIQGAEKYFLVFEMFGKGALYLLNGQRLVENAFSPIKVEKNTPYSPPIGTKAVPKQYAFLGNDFDVVAGTIGENPCFHLTYETPIEPPTGREKNPTGFALTKTIQNTETDSTSLCFASLSECADEYYKQFLDFTEKPVVNKTAEKLGKTIAQLHAELERQKQLEKDSLSASEWLGGNYELIEKALAAAAGKKKTGEKQLELEKLGFTLNNGLIQKDVN